MCIITAQYYDSSLYDIEFRHCQGPDPETVPKFIILNVDSNDIDYEEDAVDIFDGLSDLVFKILGPMAPDCNIYYLYANKSNLVFFLDVEVSLRACRANKVDI